MKVGLTNSPKYDIIKAKEYTYPLFNNTEVN